MWLYRHFGTNVPLPRGVSVVLLDRQFVPSNSYLVGCCMLLIDGHDYIYTYEPMITIERSSAAVSEVGRN